MELPVAQSELENKLPEIQVVNNSDDDDSDEEESDKAGMSLAYSVQDLMGELDNSDGEGELPAITSGPAVEQSADVTITEDSNVSVELDSAVYDGNSTSGNTDVDPLSVDVPSPTYSVINRRSLMGSLVEASGTSITDECVNNMNGNGVLDNGLPIQETYGRVYDEVLTENVYQDPVEVGNFSSSAAADVDVEGLPQQDIYENIDEIPGRDRQNHSEDDGGWGSSEFEDYEEEMSGDQLSVGAQSANSLQETNGTDPALTSTGSGKGKKGKVEMRRKLPSLGKPGSIDMMSPTAMLDKLTARLTKTKSVPEDGVENGTNGDGELQMIEIMLDTLKHPPAELPPLPEGLTTLQLKRRFIISSIVGSENSYISSLRRLVEDYEKPLLDPKTHLISKHSVQTIFHKVREILQCHHMFQIELCEVARLWDSEERIGSVFTASFSKSIVFEVYSSFVNNFSVAMETAKKQARTKPAFNDFLKQNLESSGDRLSLFGLMVKPVQRFPQFIMLLQDLVKLTPKDHHDRLRLQIALTELDTLTHRLNETKRDSENRLEAKRLLSRLGARHTVKSDGISDSTYMVRRDDMIQIKQKNGETRTKPRRLFLLGDQLVCTSVVVRDAESTSSGERLALAWTVPIKDIEVLDPSLPSSYKTPTPTASKLPFSPLTKTERVLVAIPGDNNPYKKELDDMLHDLNVLDGIASLAGQLRLRYEGFSTNALQGVTKSLQLMIRQKCDIDRCIIMLSFPPRSNTGRAGSRVQYTFQAVSPAHKHDWLLELQNVKLALEPRNHPAWYTAESEPNSFKSPLFIESLALDSVVKDSSSRLSKLIKKKSKDTTSRSARIVATCVTLPSTDLPPGIGIQHLWVCDGGRVSIVSLHTNRPCIVESFQVVTGAAVTIAESVPGCAATAQSTDKFAFSDETVWMATDDDRIVICRVVEDDRSSKKQSFKADGKVSCLKYLDGRVYVGLKNGTVHIYSRDKDGAWKVKSREKVSLGGAAVSCLLPINRDMWAACESSVHVISVASSASNKLTVTKTSHELCKDTGGHIECMVKAGVGLLVSVTERAVVRLFHTETFEALQDISVASVISLMCNSSREMANDVSRSVHITFLLSESGLLWIGTSNGFVLTMPLPRLEGVPQFKGRPTVSYHAQTGAVQFLSAVRCCTMPLRIDAAKPEPETDSGAGKSATDAKSGAAGTNDKFPTLLQKKMSASTPDLSPNSVDDVEIGVDNGSVTDLYDSLLKCVDADVDSELTGHAAILRRRRHQNHGLNSSAIQHNFNVVSNRVMNRLSHVVARGRRSSNRPQSKLEIPMAPEADNDAEEPAEIVTSPDLLMCRDLADQNADPDRESSHGSSADAQSVNDSSNFEPSPAFDRSSSANASYRRLVVPACPSMVASNLAHVQSSKALIVVSGGDGYLNWNDPKRTETVTEESCLLLWKC